MVKVELGWTNVPDKHVKAVTGIAREICKLKGFQWTNAKDVGNAYNDHTFNFMECYVMSIDGVDIVEFTVETEPADTINTWLKNQGGSIR